MIATLDNSLLREVSSPFDFNTQDAAFLKEELVETMRSMNGLGLSAVQIGKTVRAFAVATKPEVVIFNPKIVDVSTETVSLDEGCLSFPGVIIKVRRPRRIRARFQLSDGEFHTMKFEGISARIFQHELDHLDGKLFFDTASKMKVDMALKRAGRAGHDYVRRDLP